jgi:hypothetical protein
MHADLNLTAIKILSVTYKKVAYKKQTDEKIINMVKFPTSGAFVIF